MRFLIILAVFISFLCSTVDAQTKTRRVKKTSKSRTVKKKNGKQFVDLEGLDIQGLIDRPQTLYILKKSKVDFYDAIDDYDYVKVIIGTTYKAPF